ncbi:MAG: HU family DNA-binding protein [Saprospiraceae bacterium]
MNKKELIKQVSRRTDLSQKQANEALNIMLETMGKTLAAGGKVTLVDFGTFGVEYRKARKGRNPKTNVEIPIEEKIVVKFKPGKELANKVNSPQLIKKLKKTTLFF